MGVVVFPPPPPGLVTATILKLAALRSVSTTWRSTRYCAAAHDAELSRLTRCSSTRSERSKARSVAGTRVPKTVGATRGGAARSTSLDHAAVGGDADGSAVAPGQDACVRVASSLSARSSASKNLLIARAGRAPGARA